MERTLVPSFPAPSFSALAEALDALTGVSEEFQVDLVDGVFVPSISWPCNEDDPAAALIQLQPYAEKFLLEFDCMVMNPEDYLEAFARIGAQRVIAHMGSDCDWEIYFERCRAYGFQAGIAATNDVPVAEISSLAEQASFVQIMGIQTVGAQGQPFDSRTFATVSELRRMHPELEIAVDGSVNAETIPQLLSVGVNRFAPGSAVIAAEDPAGAYKQLEKLIA